MAEYYPLTWQGDCLRLLDQRRLPLEVIYVDIHTVEETAEAIRIMTIRGAPAIGVAAAYGMVLAARQISTQALPFRQSEMHKTAELLRQSRPTAVNLGWAVDRMLACASAHDQLSSAEWYASLLTEAKRIEFEEVNSNRLIGQNALPLVPQKAVFFHHCNTGTLATIGYGTALGVIRAAHESGRDVFVYVDETRPRLQGARLTAWELQQWGIPFALVVDGASGHIMRTRHVDLVTFGCDRIAANGDVANKVGSYNLALAARAHQVPVYSVGPTSTIDLTIPSGDSIVIEERAADEITRIDGVQIAPPNTPVYNPAFDLTPAEYITAIITENGIVYPPYIDNLPKVMNR